MFLSIFFSLFFNIKRSQLDKSWRNSDILFSSLFWVVSCYTAATAEKKVLAGRQLFLEKPEFTAYSSLHWNVKKQSFSAVTSLPIENRVPFPWYFIYRFSILPFFKLNFISHLSAHAFSLAKSMRILLLPYCVFVDSPIPYDRHISSLYCVFLLSRW